MDDVQLMELPVKPKREDLPAGSVLCEHCTAKCCRYFALPIDSPDTREELEYVRWFLLHDQATVLIPGPQGGVGRIAMALARRAGAHVTALIRGDGDPGPARAMGAQTVIHQIEDLAPHSQDIVLDTLGGAMHGPLAARVRPGGVLTCLTAAPIPADFTAPEGITIAFPRIQPSRARLEALIALLRGGALPDLVERAYPLAGTAQAYGAMKSGGRKGRIVLDLTDRRIATGRTV